MKLKDNCSLEGKLSHTYGILKSRDVTLQTNVHMAKAMVFPVLMYGYERKEGCMPKNQCFGTVVLEKTLETPLDCMEINEINHTGNQP